MSKKMKRELAEVDKHLTSVSRIMKEVPKVDLGSLLSSFQKQRLNIVDKIGRKKHNG